MSEKRILDKPKEIDGVPVVQDIIGAVDALKSGVTICRYEWGHSMFPILNDGEYAEVIPVQKLENGLDSIKIGDAVVCNVRGSYMTHRVIDIVNHEHRGKWFKIGSTGQDVYGWTQDVYGLAKPTNVFQYDVYRTTQIWF